MTEALAPYVIDRYDFSGVLGDCFEIIMRAVDGQTIDSIDEDGNIASWKDGTREERLKDAEYAFNMVAHHALQLCASGKAVENVIGSDYITGERFQDYMEHHTHLYNDLEGRYEARKIACEEELGLEMEFPYEGEEG